MLLWVPQLQVVADTGTTTLGLRYQGGVVLAADAAFRRGATVMAHNSDRISSVGPLTLLAACGDVPSGDQFAAYLVCEYSPDSRASPLEMTAKLMHRVFKIPVQYTLMVNHLPRVLLYSYYCISKIRHATLRSIPWCTAARPTLKAPRISRAANLHDSYAVAPCRRISSSPVSTLNREAKREWYTLGLVLTVKQT